MVIPEGYAAVTPYMLVERAEAFLTFLVEGLGGVETGRHLAPDGRVAHAEVRIGGAAVMVGEPGAEYPPMPGSYYLYVDDAAAAMARAVACGAIEIMPVADMPYGDRQGGVRDGHGNLWWISQRLTEEPYY